MARKKKPKLKQTVMWSGWDVSMTTISGAALAYDQVLGKFLGPAFVAQRWERSTNYYDRLEDAVGAPNLMHMLQLELKLTGAELEEIFIAVEEPWPYGIVKQSDSGWLKQQAEINGAFKAGLLKYGYTQIFEINNHAWRKLVADALGITTHHTKWNPTKKEGKFRAKEWAMEVWPGLPEFPDIINSKDGLIPKPDTSRAQPVQSDDRYEALAMASWMKEEWYAFSTS